MSSPTKREIQLRLNLAEAHYWLLRAYYSGHREGWEERPAAREIMDGLQHFLCDHGLDPNTSETEAWLRACILLRGDRDD